jgi:subtilisin family serine protease
MIQALLLVGLVAAASAGTIQKGIIAKVDLHGNHDIMIQFPSKLNEVLATPQMASLTGLAKRDMLIQLLKEKMTVDQAEVMTKINAHGATAKQFWISNKILVRKADQALLDTLAQVQADFIVREPATVSINPSITKSKPVSPFAPIAGEQWGVAMVEAPAAWAAGHKGEGAVVAIIDTGVNGQHVALKDGYAGAWSDPYYGDSEPTDQHGHGSHALGSAVGRENGIGVAPAAKWIACRGLNNQGSGYEGELVECAEFVLGANPKPDACSNSWGGGQDQSWYSTEIQAWKAAGIVPVFANGNGGPSCETAGSPGDQDGPIGVGATTESDTMASFSSRGPTGDGRMKPEVSAPGQDIISCGRGNNGYTSMSGTSMACPHVAGAVALLRGKNPNASFDEILSALQTTADHPELSNSDRRCGTDGGNDYPNNAFGHGRINVARAVGAK